jgi:hypothetical protein
MRIKEEHDFLAVGKHEHERRSALNSVRYSGTEVREVAGDDDGAVGPAGSLREHLGSHRAKRLLCGWF